MRYITELRQVLHTAPRPPLYPGQIEEIEAMTLHSHGCDIAEHVPVLIQYGRMVNSITEMGVRFGWSTRSFLFARPKSLLSIDKFEWNSVHQSGQNASPGNSQFQKYKSLYAGLVDFNFTLADTTELEPIEPTELLFIDTFHHKECLEIELAQHGDKASKFIILHDTQTFGECGQADDSCLFFRRKTTNEAGTGLNYAIRPFLQKNPHWRLREFRANNNGLTVLERQQ